ncbi:MAG: hypothetical protein ABSD89_05305 [Halobacteriota archaeon]|jgi:hypothetical protein
MSLGINVRGPEGLVFAAESRSTVDWPAPDGPIHINFDATNKLLTFKEPHNFVGAVTYGLGGIGNRSAYSFVPEIEAELALESRMSVEEFSKRLSSFFMSQWNKIPELKGYGGPPMIFITGGFNEGEPYGHAYEMFVPNKPEPNELPQFGITWGGQADLVHRLIKGYDIKLVQQLAEAWSLTEDQVNSVPEIAEPLELIFPLAAMALQDYVDAAILLIRTTIEAQRLTAVIRGSGGPIDVATITQRNGLQHVQQKEVMGEGGLFSSRSGFRRKC